MKKGDKLQLTKDVDLTSTGGPLLPQGTKGEVLKRQRDGRLWVDLEGFGRNGYFRVSDEGTCFQPVR